LVIQYLFPVISKYYNIVHYKFRCFKKRKYITHRARKGEKSKLTKECEGSSQKNFEMFSPRSRVGKPQNWYSFSSGVTGFYYSNSFARGEKVRVELYIDTKTAERNKEIFRQLKNEQEQIESEFGEKLSWEELPDKRAVRIAIYRQGSIDEDSKTLTEIKDWAIQKLLTFKRVFEERIKKYKE
jgi:hypothetical protein